MIARKLAVLFGFNGGVRHFYSARHFDELSRGSVSCLLNASFEKQFHNATTQFFTPKSMTMARYGANTLKWGFIAILGGQTMVSGTRSSCSSRRET